MDSIDEKYEAICKKLGFISSEIPNDVPAEEILYLYHNGYLRKDK